jgi:hypothetical protein
MANEGQERITMTRNIGMILLAILLILMALGWLGIAAIPPAGLGILAIATAIFILIGR